VLYAFAVAAILITLAELGDKTQLLALALATKYKAWQVLVGIFVATLAVHLFSTLAGGLIGNLIPAFWLSIVSGLLFIGFGVWTLRGDDDQDADEATSKFKYGPIVTTAIAFFLAELGDKTQIMTLAIAVDPGSAILVYLKGAGPTVQGWLATVGSPANVSAMGRFWAVTLGSTVGMVVADAVAILIGRLLGKNLPELLMRRVSGVIFILFGVLSIGSVLLGG
jgi:Ca2+/H+ antiporter, TMEM165/GDT1 family